MKCEPLKDKKQKIKKDFLTGSDNGVNKKSDFYSGFKKGVDDSFEVFSSFIDLFNKYKNNVNLLMKEQRDVWLKFVKYVEAQKGIDKSNYLNKYNNWLFNYIFYDVNDIGSDDLFCF
jgi:hypothetical protein